ncbi:heterodisulfide reductase-related iron-sulfur binding cluster [Candidatus Marinimicrobia bacterium]|nr:heterodisulfide reductase-related iron-sulfur binding cluster [Candidatus Neomarinimicrobiota bacterium]
MTFTTIEQIALFAMLLLSIGSFSYEIFKRFVIVSKGTGSFEFDSLGIRIKRVIVEFVLQKKVISQRFWPGLMHAFVFWGFMFFSIITLDHFSIGFNFHPLSDNFKFFYGILFGVPWAIFVLIGIISLAYRRFITRPKYLGDKISYTSGFVALFISVLMITYIIDFAYVGHNSTSLAMKVNWWIHAVLILGFLILIPRSKHLHLVLSPINIFFKPILSPSHKPVPIDMEADEEELENLLGSLDKLSKNQTLDIFSCVECGRCTEVCPAHRGGGTLDPKNHFILNLKDHLLSNQLDAVNKIDVDAGWECTTCQACSEVCPVGNEVEKSDEIRNMQVLVEGNVPQEYQKIFNNLQNTGNPDGAMSSDLTNELPAFDGTQEYVLWLGCFAKYKMDPKFTSSVYSLIKILDSAKATYGILKKEQCTGEPANRLGDKLTYNMLMQANLEELKDVQKIITMCPHCSVNLGIEYAKYAKIDYEVYHHTQIIEQFINNGNIKVNKNNAEKVTFHDPCNLSRMMGEVEAPRTAVKSCCSNFSELEESGKNTLCCGAGGGLWWKKETGGKTHLPRAQQVVDSGAETVVTGCNFCFGMMNQGLGPLLPEDKAPIKVKDVADIVAENLQ